MTSRAAAKRRSLSLLAAVCLLAALLLSPNVEASRGLPAAQAPALAAPATPDQVLEASLSDQPKRLRLFDDLRLPERPLELVEARKTASGPSTFGLGLNIGQTAGLGRICSGLSFQGLWTDPVTGISYARNRWYDARTASWLSEDPLGAVDSPNLYAFVGWGPHMGTDPMGLYEIPEEEIEAWKAAHPGYTFVELNNWIDSKFDEAQAKEPKWYQRAWGWTKSGAEKATEAWYWAWDNSAGRVTDFYKEVTSESARRHKAPETTENSTDPEILAYTMQRGPRESAVASLNEAVETGAQVNDVAADAAETGTKMYVEGKLIEVAATGLIGSSRLPARAGGTGAAYNKNTGQGLYVLFDDSGAVKYVGRGDAKARLARHASSEKLGAFHTEIIWNNNLTKAQAKGLENYLIGKYGGAKSVNPLTNLENMIRSFAPTNKNAQDYKNAVNPELRAETIRLIEMARNGI